MGTGRILLIFPHGLARCDSGMKSRYLQLVSYWERRGFVIDQVGFPCVDATSRCAEDYSIPEIRHVLLFYRKRNSYTAKLRKILSYIKKIVGILPRAGKTIKDLVYPGAGLRIAALVEENGYDYVVLACIYWHNLSSFIKGPAIKILMIDDLMSINTRHENDCLGTRTARLQDELMKINEYNLAIFVSNDEYNLCRMLLVKPRCFFVPPFMEDNRGYSLGEKRWDIVFIGSSNPHNIKGMEWFRDEVLPGLPGELKILLAGPIANAIKSEDRRIERITRFDKIKDILPHARLSICPMLSGSGIKVKVVESLSFGVPVVTTFWGSIGLPSKNSNGCVVCENAQEMRECITTLYRDKAGILALSAQAEALFREAFDTRKVERTLDDIFTLK